VKIISYLFIFCDTWTLFWIPFLKKNKRCCLGGKEGRREGGKEGRREGGKEGRREGGKEGRREGGKEGRREGGEEGRRAGAKERRSYAYYFRWTLRQEGRVSAACMRPPDTITEGEDSKGGPRGAGGDEGRKWMVVATVEGNHSRLCLYSMRNPNVTSITADLTLPPGMVPPLLPTPSFIPFSFLLPFLSLNLDPLAYLLQILSSLAFHPLFPDLLFGVQVSPKATEMSLFLHILLCSPQTKEVSILESLVYDPAESAFIPFLDSLPPSQISHATSSITINDSGLTLCIKANTLDKSYPKQKSLIVNFASVSEFRGLFKRKHM
jgi:hypothetical protein